MSEGLIVWHGSKALVDVEVKTEPLIYVWFLPSRADLIDEALTSTSGQSAMRGNTATGVFLKRTKIQHWGHDALVHACEI